MQIVWEDTGIHAAASALSTSLVQFVIVFGSTANRKVTFCHRQVMATSRASLIHLYGSSVCLCNALKSTQAQFINLGFISTDLIALQQ